jgi:hypothetical protein
MDLSRPVWRKASRSTVQNDNCVEVASAPGGVVIRDSKDPDGPRLAVSRCDFRRFAERIKGV